MSISRSFSVVDIPSPGTINVKFVYNFFTKDERTNDSGKAQLKSRSFKDENDNGNLAQSLQNQIDSLDKNSEKRKELMGILESIVPRYIDIDFSSVIIPGSTREVQSKNSGILSRNINDINNSEETILTSGFLCLKESDDDSKSRLRSKIHALSNVSNIEFSDIEQTKKLSQLTQLSQQDIQSIVSPLNDPSTLMVNSQIIKNKSKTIFENSASTKIQSQVNKRYADAVYMGADDASPLSKLDILDYLKKVKGNHISKTQQFSFSVNDHVPPVNVFGSIKKLERPESEKIKEVCVVGYRIARHMYNSDGSIEETKYFIQEGSDNTRYKDSKITYGSSYSYEVSTIVRVDAISSVKIVGDKSSLLQDYTCEISFYVISDPSSSERIVAEDYVAPNPPDGVFYKFDYENEKGLKIVWQIPSGKSRDVKHFQIFRRKSIYEPFTCLSQISFDDSEVKTAITEQVREDKILEKSSVTTFFEDFRFDRTSSWIYAIASIDAHGLTSGYSVQTEVSFDKSKNSLKLKNISRSGAPKQYPNFYIDPRLDDNVSIDSFSQDAILDSNHKKMTIYFSPDGKVCSSKDGRTEDIYVTKNQNGMYMFHFINTDLQKSSTSTVSIIDKIK